MSISIPLQVLPHGDPLFVPTYATMGAAGMDLRAAISEPVVLQPGDRLAVPTGLAIAVPQGYEAQVRPRSGLALKFGVTVVNAPGTIDSDYRGEVAVILGNFGREQFTINRGDRIAQLVVAAVSRIDWQVGESLDQTSRGAGGFGSTGTA
jgi:dUTP pyrophosphatase